MLCPWTFQPCTKLNDFAHVQWWYRWFRLQLSLRTRWQSVHIHSRSRDGVTVRSCPTELRKGMCVDMKTRAPTTGGQYHWTYMLAPASCQKFFSYIMGMHFGAEI